MKKTLSKFDKMLFVGIMIGVVLFVVYVIGMHTASAFVGNHYISIVRSVVCEKSNCVKVSDIMHYDNSNQKISGKFVVKNNDYVRSSGMKNSLNYYNIFSNKVFVFVTPDAYTIDRSQVIILVASLSEYAKGNTSLKTEKNYLYDVTTTYSGVFVDNSCHTAIVGIKQGVDLQKVIDYLASGCKIDFSYSKENITLKDTSFYCGIDCQHKKFMVEAKIKSKKLLLK